MMSKEKPIKRPSAETAGPFLDDGISPAHLRPVSILYAEADPFLRHIFTEILRRAGYPVTAVKDGHQAWRALQTGAYDLLITDNQMPHLTGVQVVAQARGDGLGLPVIIISGNLGAITIGDIETLQVAAVLQKPVFLDNLFETIARVLSQRQTWRVETGPALIR